MAKFIERHDDLENSLNRGALWAVTYGDMMSYLMIFFLILFVSTQSRGVAEQFGLHGIEEAFGNKRDRISKIFSEHGIQKIAKVDISQDRLRITFAEKIVFDPGAATLKEKALPYLIKLREALKELPNPIQIEGHTDNRPLIPGSRYRNNWELSSARAYAVLEIFLAGGLEPYRLSATGFGQFRPLAPNDTPENRAKNRRIEILLLRRKL